MPFNCPNRETIGGTSTSSKFKGMAFLSSGQSALMSTVYTRCAGDECQLSDHASSEIWPGMILEIWDEKGQVAINKQFEMATILDIITHLNGLGLER